MKIAAFDIGISRSAPCGLALFDTATQRVEMFCTIGPTIKKGNDGNVDERISEIVAAASRKLDELGTTLSLKVQ